MTFRLILLGVLILRIATGHDSDSGEVNRIEVNPYFDAIIYSDVADILNEYENNVNPLEALFTSGSESDETIEDLLSEYQHYLEKAHKQRIDYIDKKAKNKVPMTRHDRYTKFKPVEDLKYNNYVYNSNGYFTQNTIPQAYSNPLDLFIPVNNRFRYMNKSDLPTSLPKENNELMVEKRVIDAPPKPIKSSCYCKKGQIPCECKCKQCLIQVDPMPQSYVQQQSKQITVEGDNRDFTSNAEYGTEGRMHDGADNTLNIRIKVDIQLPKTQDAYTKLYKNRSREEISNSKESVNMPFPYFNFPIPMDLFGYKKASKGNTHDLTHKITIHKKKKSRISNGNKKHRNKKVITIHNLSIRPQSAKAYIDENMQLINNNTDLNIKNSGTINQTDISNNSISYIVTQKPETNGSSTTTMTNLQDTTKIIVNNTNDTQTEEGIFVVVNITNTNDNATEDSHKIENSVETEYTRIDLNIPTERLVGIRRKRDISTTVVPISTHEPAPSTTSSTSPPIQTKDLNGTNSSQMLFLKNNDSKKNDKALLADSELVYWPNSYRNQSGFTSKNITTIILDRENKKAKLNMSKEAIRSNRTRALERAIFGEVNWNDVDTVAPVFMSFVGKYLTGVLTFCSQNVCHSMKCAEKTCVHRTCTPYERWNQRGHCSGSNSTDSVASLESIMDLPSNVAFEIVDILQDKMLGKLFGKVTLCISSKCISFVVCKKSFLKSKCTSKELKTGHCPNIKNFKVM